MKIFLQLLILSIGVMAHAQEHTGIKQEENTTANFCTSQMLTANRVEKQRELELAKLATLDQSALEKLYDDLPNRSENNGMQGRTMTLNPQTACRNVEKEYKISMYGIDFGELNARWDFGDGNFKMENIAGYAGFATSKYTYRAPGRYFIIITFYDTSMRPMNNIDAKRIEVMVEECMVTPVPQIAVNPNIHKTTL